MKVYDESGVTQTLTVFRRQDRAAAGGEDEVMLAGKFGQYLGLTTPKTVFALDLEYQGNAHARSRLDFMVAIQKSALQSLG